MNTKELDKKLSALLDDFAAEIRSQYPEGSKMPVNSDDLNELARQTFYTLCSFKEEIINYLNDN